MFEFFKECDENIYHEIVEEVESNIWNKTCIANIQSEVEKIIKNIYRKSEIQVPSMGSDGKINPNHEPSLSELLNNNEFKYYLVYIVQMSDEKINEYWEIHDAANYKKHGPLRNKVISIDDELKKKALHFLFDLCIIYYKFVLQKEPSANWDEAYFQSLLEEPKNKVIEVEKEKIVERVIEKPIEKIVVKTVEKPIEKIVEKVVEKTVVDTSAIESKEKEIATLLSNVKVKNVLIDNLKQEIESIKKQNENLVGVQELEAKEKELAKLSNKVDDKNQLIDNLKKEIEGLRKQSENLVDTKVIEAKEREIASLSATMKEKDQIIDDLKKENEVIKQQPKPVQMVPIKQYQEKLPQVQKEQLPAIESYQQAFNQPVKIAKSKPKFELKKILKNNLQIIATLLILFIAVALLVFVSANPYLIYGNGSVAHPYKIYSASDLATCAQDANYRLMSDIDFTVETIPEFSANLDLNSHTIKTSKTIFDTVSGTIKNGTIQVSGNITITDDEYYGYLCKNNDGNIGYLTGKIDNIKVTLNSPKNAFVGLLVGKNQGQIDGIKIIDCDENTNFKKIACEQLQFQERQALGTVVGFNMGKISNCTNYKNIESLSQEIGGICGYNDKYGIISDCVNSAEITMDDSTNVSDLIPILGGIVAYNKGTIQQSKNNTGKISVTSLQHEIHVGGIVGHCDANSVIEGCSNSAVVTGNAKSHSVIGGICGFALKNSHFEKCINAGNINSVSNEKDSLAGGICGSVESNVTIKQSKNQASVSANSKNESACSGGIVGCLLSNGLIDGCQSTYGISAKANGNAYSGGICGLAKTDTLIKYSMIDDTTDNSIYASSKVSSGYAGGIVAVTSGDVENCLAETYYNYCDSYYEYVNGTYQLVKYYKNSYILARNDETENNYTSLFGGIVGQTSGSVKKCISMAIYKNNTGTSSSRFDSSPASDYYNCCVICDYGEGDKKYENNYYYRWSSFDSYYAEGVHEDDSVALECTYDKITNLYLYNEIIEYVRGEND